MLDEALAQGRPVVVDWTAYWWIHCKVFEKTVLSHEEFLREAVQRNAVLLRADLSEENLQAQRLNQALRGQAIPVLAIFTPGRAHAPRVLRNSYSVGSVVRELSEN